MYWQEELSLHVQHMKLPSALHINLLSRVAGPDKEDNDDA